MPKNSKASIALQAALANGESTYQGQPCRRGHSGIRYVTNRNCVECGSNQAKRARKAQREAEQARQEAKDTVEAARKEAKRLLDEARRKARRKEEEQKKRLERDQWIADQVEAGVSGREIAKAVGIGQPWVARIAKAQGAERPRKWNRAYFYRQGGKVGSPHSFMENMDYDDCMALVKSANRDKVTLFEFLIMHWLKTTA